MGINKVQYGNTTLIDLTSDTVTADKLMQGYTAHDRSGAIITGTATGGGTGAISVVDTEDTHGGTIRTITALDISDTTAVASDVAQGKYFYTADGTKTAGTSSGGGGTEDADAVQFIDYDGTVLYEYSAEQFLALSAMPANPSHTGLTAQGWNWTLADAQDYVDEYGYLVIGQMYIPTSGATEIDIELHKGRLSPCLSFGVNGEAEIDWGDNSATETVIGSDANSIVHKQHTYASEGSYTIKVLCGNNDYIIFRTGSTSHPFINAGDLTLSTYRSRVYANAVKSVRYGIGAREIGYYSMTYFQSMETLTFHQSFTSADGASNGMYNLKSITFPYGKSNAVTLESYCLKNASFPKGCNLSTNAISNGCYNLKKVTLSPNTNAALSSSLYLLPLEIIVNSYSKYKKVVKGTFSILPSLQGKNAIQMYQFSNVQVRYTADIPSGITTIYSYAFAYSMLMSVTIPSTVTTINGSAFQNTYLESITIPSTVTSLSGGNICGSCSCLKSVNILASITTIPASCFTQCYSLKSVSLPSTVTTLGSSAFNGCTSLAEITLPSNLTTIAGSVFAGCHGLSNITIPSTVTSIGTSAFSNCYGLGEIHLKPTTPPTITNTNVFNNLPTDCVIYVPSASLSTYQTAQYWSTWASQMVGE